MKKLNLALAVASYTLLLHSAHAAAPQANADARLVPMNTPITIDVLNNDRDADGDTIRLFEIVRQPANGTATIVGNSVRYQPQAGFSGTDSFDYTIADNTEEVSAAATVSITVSNDVLTNAANEGNDKGVASALDAACARLLQSDTTANAGQQQLRQRCNALRELALTDSAAAARVMNQIAPEETIALMQVAGSGSQNHSEAVSQRLTGIGRGVSSVSVNGLTYVLGKPRGGAAGDDSIMARGGFFASVQLETADKDTTQLENGFDYDANSVTAGADYFVNDRWLVGAAAGLAKNELEYKNEDGQVEATLSSIITYTSFNETHWSADFQLGYAAGDYDIGRYIRYDTDYDTVNTTTEGSTSGEQFFAAAQWQYLWSYRAATVYPSVKLGYQKGRIADYAENNAAGFEVLLGDQGSSQVTAQLGVQAQYAMNFSWGVLVPLAEVNLVSELSSKQDDIVGRFAFSPTNSETFIITAEDGDSAFYDVSLGTSFIIPNGVSGFVRYDQTFGYDDFSAQRLAVGVRMEF